MVTFKDRSSPKPEKKLPEPQTHFVQKAINSDTYLVMAQSQIEIEDEYSSLYYTPSLGNNFYLQPPFNPLELLRLVSNNNILNQCVEAMEVNVDGTGYDFVGVEDGEDPDPEEEAAAISFFNEPYPNTSFTSIRRTLRRQVESIGYSYLEVLRNALGDVVGARNVETNDIRMVKLDEPIQVTKTVTRNGKDVELTYSTRERRYGQRVALTTQVYYKDFGVSRNLNRDTGEWEVPGAPVPPEKLATELIMFGVHPDARSPYYLPRWINEMPSVIGSRKAEEQNLEFLDSGGMPPAIIFVQGGTLAKDTSDQLRQYLSGQNKQKNRAVVVEAQSSSGSLDSAGSVQVKVERFGAQQAQDAMYMKYDASTEDHVRLGFRLPPLFVGKAADYNFATAITAYMVAEAQVFQPERTAFDETINMTLIKAMGWKSLKMKSRPITLKDVANQVSGLTLAKDRVDNDSFVAEINKMTGMDLKATEQLLPDSITGSYAPDGSQVTAGGRTIPGTQGSNPNMPPMLAPQVQQVPDRGTTAKPAFQSNMPQAALPAPGKGTTPGAPKKLRKSASELIDLAHSYAGMRGLVKKREVSAEEELLIKQELSELDREDRESFNRLLAQYTFGSDSTDLTSIVGELI